MASIKTMSWIYGNVVRRLDVIANCQVPIGDFDVDGELVNERGGW
jgi:hypothetical protein